MTTTENPPNPEVLPDEPIVSQSVIDILCRQFAEHLDFPNRDARVDGVGPYADEVAAKSLLNAQGAARAGKLTWALVVQARVTSVFASPTPDVLRARLVDLAAETLSWIEDVDSRTLV